MAAGTSTGGLTNKLPGWVGDSPLIGAGTYHDVATRMLYKKLTVADAAREAIDELPDEGDGVGGLIALDRASRAAFAMSKLSVGMYRG